MLSPLGASPESGGDATQPSVSRLESGNKANEPSSSNRSQTNRASVGQSSDSRKQLGASSVKKIFTKTGELAGKVMSRN